MMSGVIREELHAVGAAFLGGMLITFVYDLLRIFRRAVLHGNLWIGAEDAVFWIWASLWIFSVLYRENDGSFRSYTLLAMAAGMIGYHRTVSEVFVKTFGGFLRKIVLFLDFPLKILKKTGKGIIIKIIRCLKKHFGGMTSD